MEQKVKTMICRFRGCCTKGLNCPWLHTLEETQIFKDELALRQRKLAVRCGFCARGGVPVWDSVRADAEGGDGGWCGG